MKQRIFHPAVLFIAIAVAYVLLERVMIVIPGIRVIFSLIGIPVILPCLAACALAYFGKQQTIRRHSAISFIIVYLIINPFTWVTIFGVLPYMLPRDILLSLITFSVYTALGVGVFFFTHKQCAKKWAKKKTKKKGSSGINISGKDQKNYLFVIGVLAFLSALLQFVPLFHSTSYPYEVGVGVPVDSPHTLAGRLTTALPSGWITATPVQEMGIMLHTNETLRFEKLENEGNFITAVDVAHVPYTIENFRNQWEKIDMIEDGMSLTSFIDQKNVQIAGRELISLTSNTAMGVLDQWYALPRGNELIVIRYVDGEEEAKQFIEEYIIPRL